MLQLLFCTFFNVSLHSLNYLNISIRSAVRSRMSGLFLGILNWVGGGGYRQMLGGGENMREAQT